MEERRETWGSSLGFILAAAGSAIGLGNVWKFPYMTGRNGGGAFVLVYLFCVILLGLPLMICEITIGRKTGKNPYAAFKALQNGPPGRTALVTAVFCFAGALALFIGKSWGLAVLALVCSLLILRMGFAFLGLIEIFAALAIMTYYSVVGGWILDYIVLSFSGSLDGFATVDSAKDVFISLAAPKNAWPWRAVVMHLVFMTLCAAMLFAGIRKGIERWSKVLMPLLFLLLLAVIVRGILLPGSEKGIDFFLKPDFSKITVAGVLDALGQAFFSLSLGMAIMITYGSYLGKEQNIFVTSLSVVVLDTFASVLAGLAIFPAVFAMNFQPDSGISLVFEVLPAAFRGFPGGFGWFWCGVFFILLTIAAVTSGASLLEVGVTWLMDEFNLRRKPAVVFLAAVLGAAGILSAVSCPFSGWKNLSGFHAVLEKTCGNLYLMGDFFQTVDFFCSNWILPLAGMFTAIFAGWVWGTAAASRELRMGTHGLLDINIFALLSGLDSEQMYRTGGGMTLISLWSLLMRFFAPPMILFVFLRGIGVI